MGDFNEHVLFGFLMAAVVFHLSGNFFTMSYPQVIAASIGLLIGSIIPDIDHKNSKIHRSARAALSMGLGVFLGYLLSNQILIGLLIFLTVSSVVYLSFNLIKIKHRGFTHSITFAIIITSSCVTLGALTLSSAIPGFAVGIGLISHLLLDTEFKLK